jgi:hypothetical protein
MITTTLGNNSKMLNNPPPLHTCLIQAKRQVLNARTPQQRFRWLIIQAVIEGKIAESQEKQPQKIPGKKPAKMVNYNKTQWRRGHA